MTYKIGTEAYRKQYYLDHKEEIAARSKKRWDAKRDEILANNRKHYADDKNYRQYILQRCKARAKQKGIEFTLTVDDILIPAVCPVFGIPLERSRNGKAAPNSPSVDRIDSTRGYTPDNIQIISYKANCMKNNATQVELFLFAQWILDS